jgi:hypothetical protein
MLAQIELKIPFNFFLQMKKRLYRIAGIGSKKNPYSKWELKI